MLSSCHPARSLQVVVPILSSPAVVPVVVVVQSSATTAYFPWSPVTFLLSDFLPGQWLSFFLRVLSSLGLQSSSLCFSFSLPLIFSWLLLLLLFFWAFCCCLLLQFWMGSPLLCPNLHIIYIISLRSSSRVWTSLQNLRHWSLVRSMLTNSWNQSAIGWSIVNKWLEWVSVLVPQLCQCFLCLFFLDVLLLLPLPFSWCVSNSNDEDDPGSNSSGVLTVSSDGSGG